MHVMHDVTYLALGSRKHKSTPMKKLSDVYVIRGNIRFPADGNDPIETLTIDTGLDALRREILAIWEVDFQPTNPKSSFVTAIEGVVPTMSHMQQLSCSVLRGNSVPTAQETLSSNNYIAGFSSDTLHNNTYITVGGASSVTTDTVGFSNNTDYNSAEMPSRDALPIGYVVQGEFYLVADFDAYDATNTSWYEGCDIRIYGQRMQADAALYAALIAGQL